MKETTFIKPPFKHRLILALVPLAAVIIRLIGLTWRVKVLDPHKVRPVRNPAELFIYAFWHNQQVLSTWVFRNFGVRVLVSRSKDGDYVSKIIESFGFGTVRSSTSSGKINALRGLARELQSGHHVVITPDGPRGPVYQAKPGVIFLAALAGKRVVPFGCVAGRAWKLHRTWDGFEIPKLFSRVVIILGEAFSVPRQLDDEAASHWTRELQEKLTQLREQARAELNHE